MTRPAQPFVNGVPIQGQLRVDGHWGGMPRPISHFSASVATLTSATITNTTDAVAVLLSSDQQLKITFDGSAPSATRGIIHNANTTAIYYVAPGTTACQVFVPGATAAQVDAVIYDAV